MEKVALAALVLTCAIGVAGTTSIEANCVG